jgi:hypothetical protein
LRFAPGVGPRAAEVTSSSMRQPLLQTCRNATPLHRERSTRSYIRVKRTQTHFGVGIAPDRCLYHRYTSSAAARGRIAVEPVGRAAACFSASTYPLLHPWGCRLRQRASRRIASAELHVDPPDIRTIVTILTLQHASGLGSEQREILYLPLFQAKNSPRIAKPSLAKASHNTSVAASQYIYVHRVRYAADMAISVLGSC